MKPTDEQKLAFLKWCEVYDVRDDQYDFSLAKGGGYTSVKWVEFDLNFLFKYAVPKLCEMGCMVDLSVSPNKKCTSQVIPRRTNQSTYGESEDPALALFWAIWEVIKDEVRG